jgi:uncharacterized RDD family membrane protein YckC
MTTMGFSEFPYDAAEAPALTDAITARRVGAWLIDAIILAILLGVMHLVLWILGFVTFGLGWFLLGGLWVVPVAYLFAFVASPAQATPGQALADLRVVRDDDLGRPTPAQALVYAVGYAVTMAAGAIWLVAAFFTRRARCLHDIVAGTAVLRANALGAVPAPLGGTATDGWAVR